MTTRYCQQWTLAKGGFAGAVSIMTGLHPRIVLAWMATESGGSKDAPGGASFNFLQIKEKGSRGTTSGGFAKYRNWREAANHAAKRIKGEPGILQSINLGSDRVMKAIARTWDDAPGRTVGSVPMGYYSRLRDKFNCIDRDEVEGSGLGQFGASISGPYNEAVTRRLGNIMKGGKEEGPVGALKAAAGEGVDIAAGGLTSGIGDLLEGVWPVLLRVALAGTGLALIGFGVVKMTGSGQARVHVTQATSTGAAVAGGG